MDGSPLPDNIESRGMIFPKDPAIIHGRVRRLLRRNAYEAKETEAALRVVREGDKVIELGAGIGYMSTLVATKRRVAEVHCFEANPLLVPYIERVHAANGVTCAEVSNAILGPRKGQADFYVRDDLLSSSLSVLEGESDPPATRIDVLNARQTFARIKPDVLICDIEGAEAELIPQLDLSCLRAAVIETHPQWIGPKGINTVMQAFMDAGLAYYHRGSHGKVLAFRTDW